MGKPVNAWQAVLYNLIHSSLIVPKRIAFRLHADPDHLGDICRRDRIDPIAIFNEILKQAADDFHNNQITIGQYQEICVPILYLLLDDTRWLASYIPPAVAPATSGNKLCEQAGILCEDLGGTLKAFAAVEDDGRYNEHDDVRIGECDIKIGMVISRLQAMRIELHRRRSAGVQL